MKIFQLFLDFIFPKDRSVAKLESLSSGQLSNLLPGTRDTLDSTTTSLFRYDDKKVKQLVWEIKYNKNLSLINKVAELLNDEILTVVTEAALFENFVDPLLVPVPASDLRMKERGFDQCLTLVKAIAKINPELKVLSALTRDKEVTPQTKMESRDDRLKNMKDVFVVKDSLTEAVAGRNIILIDDVYTTGATIADAKRALDKVGARKVLAFTVAH